MLQDNPVIPQTDDPAAATTNVPALADAATASPAQTAPPDPAVDRPAAPEAIPVEATLIEPEAGMEPEASMESEPSLPEHSWPAQPLPEQPLPEPSSPDASLPDSENSPTIAADWSAASRALVVLEADAVQSVTDNSSGTGADDYDNYYDNYSEGGDEESVQGRWGGWPVLAAIGLVCVVSFGGSLFLFTRPCAIGSCRPLELAERLQQQAIDQANADIYTLTTADLAKSRQHILRAIDYLGQVPRWSEAANEANRLLPQYRAQLKTLDLIIAAQDKATAAAQRSQNPPHPLAEWTAIRALWQEAIAPLEKVPTTSDLAPLAERKLVEYRVNLTAITQRIQREQESDRHLTTAKTAADTAESRQPHATTLADWQELATLWESAVRPLQLIPSGTMAHAPATDLLPYYQGKLNTVRDRIAQEEAAEATYRRALQLAEQAKASERQNQWSKALTEWQQARSLLQEVPPDTIPAAQAQARIPTYDEAIRSVQSNLVAFNNLQNIRNDLEQACGGQPRRCTHSVSASAITVTLTPNYEATLNTAERLQSELVRAEITNQWQALDFALQSISRNAGIPVQMYDSTGSLLTTYSPNG